MRCSRRGRKLAAVVAAEAVEASAGLRPDQAITEAAVGRVLPTPIRRRAGAPLGCLQDGSVTKRAFGYSGAQVGGREFPTIRPALPPAPSEIGTERARPLQRFQGAIRPVQLVGQRSVLTHLEDGRPLHLGSVGVRQRRPEHRYPAGPRRRGSRRLGLFERTGQTASLCRQVMVVLHHVRRGRKKRLRHPRECGDADDQASENRERLPPHFRRHGGCCDPV